MSAVLADAAPSRYVPSHIAGNPATLTPLQRELIARVTALGPRWAGACSSNRACRATAGSPARPATTPRAAVAKPPAATRPATTAATGARTRSTTSAKTTTKATAKTATARGAKTPAQPAAKRPAVRKSARRK